MVSNGKKLGFGSVQVGRVGSGRAPSIFGVFFPPSSWSFFPRSIPCLFLHKDSPTSLDNNLDTPIQWNVLGFWKGTTKITPLRLTVGILPSSTVRPTVADKRFKLRRSSPPLHPFLCLLLFFFSFSFFFSLFLSAVFPFFFFSFLVLFFFSFFFNPKRVVQLTFLSPYLLPAVRLLPFLIDVRIHALFMNK